MFLIALESFYDLHCEALVKRLNVKELNMALRFPFSILSRNEAVTGPVKKALLDSLREQGRSFS